MRKGLARVIFGIILIGVGIFGWYQVLMESIPTSTKPIEPTHTFDSVPVIIVHSIIAGIGVVVLVSGVRSSRSS